MHNMKYRNMLLPKAVSVAAVSALLLVSCAKEDFNWLIGTPINVTANAEQPVTRSGSNIQTKNFDYGAQLNAYYHITGGEAIGKTPTILTAAAAGDDGKNRLTPDVQPYFPSTGTVDILALYPTEVTSATTSFEVSNDQQEETAYKAGDLMWAGRTGVARTTGDVDLTFEHLMAKMTVKVTGKEGVRIDRVSLLNVVRKIDVTTLSASEYVLGDLATVSDASQKTILLASKTDEAVNNSLSGSALFPPQTITGQFIKVETNYGDAYYSVTGKAFDGGTAYSADLVVKRQDIGFTTTITEWEANNGSIAVPPGSSAGLKIATILPQEYNGSEQTPPLYITYTPNSDAEGIKAGTYTLKPSTDTEQWDYKAEYFNNINQGTAMVIITGQLRSEWSSSGHDSLALGNLVAQLKAMTSFEITAATGNLEYPATTKEVEYLYNTTVDHPLNTHNGDGKFTYSSSDPTVADVTVSGVVTIRKAGTTRITASMDNSGNYSAATAYYDLTVKPRSLKNNYVANNTGDVTVTMASESFPYNGEAYKPYVVVKDKGRTLQENVHYTTSYTNNTNQGTATITIKGTGNYSDANADAITKTFTITSAEPEITFNETEVKLAKGQKLTRRAKTDFGTITYSVSPEGYATVSSDGVVTATNCGANHANQTVTVTASVAAGTNNNWIAASKSYSLTIVESDWSYGYTGDVQTWECPVDGIWELEAMGAKGQDNNSFNGGRGADVAGQVYIKEGQKLYIYVGQAGSTSAGFNGGGSSSSTGGGGATDYALKNATWSTDDHLYSRILVAGGGGGALYWSIGPNVGVGGSGGGEGEEGVRADYQGETGNGGSHPGGGGKINGPGVRTSGASNGNDGSFGKGGNYSGSDPAGGGGGGWYGGASGATGSSNNRQGSGGGGSSFIYNATNIAAAGKIKDNKTYDQLIKLPSESEGNYFTTSSLEIVPTILITGGSPDANGQARITYKSAE